MFIDNLGYNIIDIRAAHTFVEKDHAVQRFNNSKNSVRVLIFFTRITSASVNLQKNCRIFLFIDVSGSANIVLQSIGRLYRIGQKRECRVFLVILDEFYDQVMQARAKFSN